MSTKRVNYDEVAPSYDRRYAKGGPEGLAAALLRLMGQIGAETVLEVGCGTGYWLASLQAVARRLVGLDLSTEMLRRAQARKETFRLVQGQANRLPFAHGTFDAVVCVHALHHFDQPEAFVHGVRPLIRPGGALGIVGMDPHTGRDRWYLYDYFPGTFEADLARYSPAGKILEWMIAAGFDHATWCQVARILDRRIGRDLLTTPWLHKHSTSQLALLTDEAYTAGMAQIEAALAAAEAVGDTLAFTTDIALYMISGFVDDA